MMTSSVGRLFDGVAAQAEIHHPKLCRQSRNQYHPKQPLKYLVALETVWSDQPTSKPYRTERLCIAVKLHSKIGAG